MTGDEKRKKAQEEMGERWKRAQKKKEKEEKVVKGEGKSGGTDLKRPLLAASAAAASGAGVGGRG